MTATQQFIEDAIKGGWLPELWRLNPNMMQVEEGIRGHVFDEFEPTPPEVILLDPLAWHAVGKTRGWDIEEYPDRVYEAWDTFFYELYNGKTIEEALQAIS
jgi:hypothetical protein